MLAYVAGIGALFAALAVSFFVFFATPHEPLQTETQHKMQERCWCGRARRTSRRPKRAQSETQRKAPALLKKVPKDTRLRLARRSLHRRRHPPEIPQRKRAASTAQARRLIQEERAPLGLPAGLKL
jgi:hypothetical protein